MTSATIGRREGGWRWHRVLTVALALLATGLVARGLLLLTPLLDRDLGTNPEPATTYPQAMAKAAALAAADGSGTAMM